MAHHDSNIRPETVALNALIRDTLDRAQGQGSRCTANALLFLGSGHRGFPAAVVRDCVLEPVDKLVWMVIYQSGLGTGACAVFPSYTDIARLANVSSTATVSRAIAILRATRWLSRSARSRDASARFGGTVYALHDGALPLADAMVLDPGYRAFLEGASRHHHARVRRVAAAVAASLNENARPRKDVPAPVNREKADRVPHPGGGRRTLSFGAALRTGVGAIRAQRRARDVEQESKAVTQDPQNLKAVATHPQNLKAEATHHQNLKAMVADPQNLKAAVHHPQNSNAVTRLPLIFPERLKANQRSVAARHLAQIPGDLRQSVLDELEGRLQAERHGAIPVYDELRYLRHLCWAVNQGGFRPNLALKVQAERDCRQRDMERLHEEAAAREREREERASRPKGTDAVAEIRKKLGLPPTPRRRPR